MAKILCGKTRKTETPWAIFTDGDWEWRVLKNWQKDPNQDYARWFCAVKSPHTMGSADLGDTYVAEVCHGGTLKAAHPDFITLMELDREILDFHGIEILED